MDLYDLIIVRSHLLIRKYMLIIYVFLKKWKNTSLLLYKHIYICALYIHIYIYYSKHMNITILHAHLNLGRTCQDDPRDIRGIRQVLQFSTLSKILGEYMGNILFIYGQIYIYTYTYEHIIYIYIINIYTYHIYHIYICDTLYMGIYGNIYIIKWEDYIYWQYIYMGIYGNDDT